MEVNAEQLLKQSLGKLVNPEGNSMEVKDEQPLKQELPKLVTLVKYLNPLKDLMFVLCG